MKKSSEVRVAEHVAKKLSAAGIQFSQERVVGGFAPDFLLDLPDGRQVIVEVKAWQPLRKNVDRAVRQARYYTAATGVDGTYIVLPGLGRGEPEKGVVGERYLVQFLTRPKAVESARRRIRKGKPRER